MSTFGVRGLSKENEPGMTGEIEDIIVECWHWHACGRLRDQAYVLFLECLHFLVGLPAGFRVRPVRHRQTRHPSILSREPLLCKGHPSCEGRSSEQRYGQVRYI